jgi:hypothetical protein
MSSDDRGLGSLGNQIYDHMPSYPPPKPPEPPKNPVDQHQQQQQQEQQQQQQQQQQSSHNDNDNYNTNGNTNYDSNLNGNGNLNANANFNVNSTCVTVDVKVDATVDSQTPDAGDQNVGIDMGHLYIDAADLSGGLFLLPNNITQTLNGGGGTDTQFNVEQVNNLVANNNASGITLTNDDSFSTSQSADGGTATGIGLPSSGDEKSVWDKMDHAQQQAASEIDSHNSGDGNTFTNSADASANNTVDAFTQSIVMGANVQLNNFATTVTGHDSSVTDHHATDSSTHS